jgi:hypothetical protein
MAGQEDVRGFSKIFGNQTMIYHSVKQTADGKPNKVGIVGGAGYTGGELIRILINHPFASISFVHSKSNAGKFLYSVHRLLKRN